MTRLRSILSAAALVVAGGVALGIALNQAGQQLNMTCAEWSRLVERAKDSTEHHDFFLVTSVLPPEAYGDRVIGTLSGGVGTVKPNACEDGFTFTYKVSAPVSGKRLVRVHAPVYTAAALKQWAQATTGAAWLGSYSEAYEKCANFTTQAICKAVLGSTVDCWIRADDTLCRYGRLYGPGRGGDQACTPDPAIGDRPYPCELPASQSPEDEANRVWSDQDLE